MSKDLPKPTTVMLPPLFQAIGAEFLTPPPELKAKLAKVRAYVFDWDGVFNDGRKGENTFSSFSEPDSMGLNLLRLGYWFNHKHQLPVCGIITGQENESAKLLANREHLHVVYSRVKQKNEALDHLLEEQRLTPEEVLFVFDDVLDVPVARRCGVAIAVRRAANPLFSEFLKQGQICDYITGSTGGQYAVREVCELVLGMAEVYDAVLQIRIEDPTTYNAYLEQRNSFTTSYYYPPFK